MNVGGSGPNLNANELESAFLMLDTDGDHKVSKLEFLAFWKDGDAYEKN